MSSELPVEVGHVLPDLGIVVLSGAEADLAAPTIEASKNWGPRIQLMLTTVGVFVPNEWNAAALSTWVLEAAARSNRKSPIAGSPSGETLVSQLQAAGRWLPKALLTPQAIRPGMIAAAKAHPNYSVVWLGVVQNVAPDGALTCIDGEAENPERTLRDRVGLRTRLIDDPLFLGCGYL